jgi:hypothetical protein
VSSGSPVRGTERWISTKLLHPKQERLTPQRRRGRGSFDLSKGRPEAVCNNTLADEGNLVDISAPVEEDGDTRVDMQLNKVGPDDILHVEEGACSLDVLHEGDPCVTQPITPSEN